jgi:hypothetical protein
MKRLVNGTNGHDGPDGMPGSNGADGADGTNGLDGNDGEPGADGRDGGQAQGVAELESGHESIHAKRLRLTSGIVPKFQLSRPYAFFANMTADGDFGILVDTDPASPTCMRW